MNEKSSNIMFHKVEVILGLQLESSIKIVVRFFIWSDALIVSWSGWLVFLLVTSVSKTCKFQPLFFIQALARGRKAKIECNWISFTQRKRSKKIKSVGFDRWPYLMLWCGGDIKLRLSHRCTNEQLLQFEYFPNQYWS